VLDEKECQIQAQQGMVMVSQGDRVILKREECKKLYKLKQESPIWDGVLGISLEGSSSRGGVSRKTATRREPGQSVTGMRKSAFG